MPLPFKRSAVVVAALAALFYWAFMFAKHDPALRPVIPFGVDPYDAVGSLGVVVGGLIAMVSLVRAFRPYRRAAPSSAQRLYLVRSQMAVVLAVFITVVADAAAMARHPAAWIDSPARGELFSLLGGLVVVAAVVLFLIRSSSDAFAARGSGGWMSAAVMSLLSILVLALYPEQLIRGLATHLLTVVVGDVLLFAPMRPLLSALVPADPRVPEPVTTGGVLSNHRRRWGAVVFVALLCGVFAFAGEMSEGTGGQSLVKLLFVAGVFIGLAVAGLLIAYAFIGKPLGLVPRA